MSYHYLQGSALVSSAHIFADLEQSVVARLVSTNGELYSSVSAMASFLDSQSGTMSEQCAEPSSEAKSMLSLEDSLAKMSQVWDQAMAYWAKHQGYGSKWQGLSAKLDLRTYSWKMVGFSLDADYQECLLIWPLSGMMLDGVAWEQKRLVPIIKGSVAGYWPTPTKQIMARRKTAKRSHWKSHDGTTLLDAVLLAEKDSGQPFRFDTGYLNPEWLEWLMGAPIGWSGLRPLGTDKFRNWLQLCGIY